MPLEGGWTLKKISTTKNDSQKLCLNIFYYLNKKKLVESLDAEQYFIYAAKNARFFKISHFVWKLFKKVKHQF